MADGTAAGMLPTQSQLGAGFQLPLPLE